MKISGLKFIFYVSLICLLCACQRNAYLQHLAGNSDNLADYRGKWIILNYWAGWCNWCVKEIPELNQFYKSHKNNNVVVFGVNYDHLPPTELQQLASQLNIQFPLLTNDPIAQLGFTNIAGLPATFVITPEGKLLAPLLGGQTHNSLETIIKNN